MVPENHDVSNTDLLDFSKYIRDFFYKVTSFLLGRLIFFGFFYLNILFQKSLYGSSCPHGDFWIIVSRTWIILSYLKAIILQLKKSILQDAEKGLKF